MPPTQDNGTSLSRNWTEANITVNTSNIDTFQFNWNGTNYTFYDNSLILAYNFNNNSAIGESATKAVDISKYGRNATCSGAACPTFTSSGKYNGAYEFNGIYDNFTIPHSISLMPTTAITVEAWVRPNTSSGC